MWEKENDIFQIDFFLNEAGKYMKRDKFPDFQELVRHPKETRNVFHRGGFLKDCLAASLGSCRAQGRDPPGDRLVPTNQAGALAFDR